MASPRNPRRFLTGMPDYSRPYMGDMVQWRAVAEQLRASVGRAPLAGGKAARLDPPARPVLKLAPLPVLDDIQEPLRVWKLAGITMELQPGECRFYGVGLGQPARSYPGRDAAAVCYRKEYQYQYSYPVTGELSKLGTRWLPDHDAPHDHCTCGFYANPARLQPARDESTWWEVEAELFGRYVKHADGWRFGRQRILAVRVPARCSICSLGPPPDTAFLAWDTGYGVFQQGGGIAVSPAHQACTERAASSYAHYGQPPPFHAVTFDQLRDHLGGIELLGPRPLLGPPPG